MRKIIHIDMDAFYASVEQRDMPELRGKPVIVGGDPKGRGVVAACSYEARKFGVHSAMPCGRAARLCPEAVFLRPRFGAYKEVSAQIRDIFLEYTDLVEPLSLDEAYLDVTENKKRVPSATVIASDIRAMVLAETGLTASAGVSYNKFLAKVASDFDKPDGMTVITPKDAADFIARLPVGKFHGVGKVTEKKMHGMGIRTGADLLNWSEPELVQRFGKAGGYYYRIARGVDDRPVSPDRERKSVGKERTLAEDLEDRAAMLDILGRIAAEVERALDRLGEAGRTVTLKVKYHDFVSVTRSVTLERDVRRASEMMELVPALLASTDAGPRKVRLLGITISNLIEGRRAEDEDGGGPRQLWLPFME